MTHAVSSVSTIAPQVSMSVPVMALACPKAVRLPPSVRQRVDSGDDELVNIMAPLLRC
jgi:hypothetical protein